MKPTLFLFAIASLALLPFPATAQKAEKKSGGGDPFIKGDGADLGEEVEKAESEAKNSPKSYSNVGAFVQWIDVKRETWESWLENNAVPLDAGELRQQAETWIAEGEAELNETSLVMGRSGHRSLVQSARKIYYPTEFDLGKGAHSFPVAFDCREEGTILEIDPMLGNAGTVDLNLAPTLVRYRGENPPRELGVGIEPTDIRWPDFQLLKATVQLGLDSDQWALLGSELPIDERDSHRTLIFVRPVVHHFETLGNNKTPEAPSPFNGEGLDSNALDEGFFIGTGGVTPTGEGTMKLEWIEIDHASLNRELLSPEKLGQRIGGGLHEWAEKNDGELLETRTLRFRSGQRVKNESVEELIHPTEFRQGEVGVLSLPRANQTVNVGITVETDPIFESGGGAVLANLAAEWVTRHGTTTHHRVQINDEWVPDVTYPRLYEMQSTSQVSVPMNVPTLVSIMSPPGEEGVTDTSRKVLLFLTVSR